MMLKTPEFWYHDKPTILARLLQPLSMVMNQFAARRLRKIRSHATIPVICIGNFVAGGAGKTPTAIALAKLISKENDYNISFIASGYKGKYKKAHHIVDRNGTAGEFGDEAILLSNIKSTVVSRNRLTAALIAANMGKNIAIMDDGLFNSYLEPDINIIVIDGKFGLGNGLVIPAGPLRTAHQNLIKKAHAIISLGDGKGYNWAQKQIKNNNIPIFKGLNHFYLSNNLKKSHIILWSATANPAKVLNSARELGLKIIKHIIIPDHHLPSKSTAKKILYLADKHNASIVSTEKDLVRIKEVLVMQELYKKSQQLNYEVKFNQETAKNLKQFILEKINYLVTK